MAPKRKLQYLPIEERQRAPYAERRGALPVHRDPSIRGDPVRQCLERHAITRSGIIYTVLITGVLIVALTLTDRSVLALFMGTDSPALPIARHIHMLATWNFLLFGVTMVLFGTVRANGAVWGPLIILCVGLVPIRFGFIFASYPELNAYAIWLSFPASSFVNLVLAIAFYLHGGWRKAKMAIQPSTDECIEEAEATREAGGALNPAG